MNCSLIYEADQGVKPIWHFFMKVNLLKYRVSTKMNSDPCLELQTNKNLAPHAILSQVRPQVKPKGHVQIVGRILMI